MDALATIFLVIFLGLLALLGIASQFDCSLPDDWNQ
jgi:hypothetical protein